MKNVGIKAVIGHGKHNNISIFELFNNPYGGSEEYSRYIGYSYGKDCEVYEDAPIEEYLKCVHDHIDDDEQRYETLYFTDIKHLSDWLLKNKKSTFGCKLPVMLNLSI